jgi:hypothetical protein
MVSCGTLSSSGGRPNPQCRSVHAQATSRRCQRSSVCGITTKQDQRAVGNTRLERARSAGSSFGRGGRWMSTGRPRCSAAGSHGDAAGMEPGSSLVERIAMNTGSVLVCPLPRDRRGGSGWAHRRLIGPGGRSRRSSRSVGEPRTGRRVAERSLTGVVLVYDLFTSRSRTQRVKNPTRTCGAKSFDTVIDDRLAGDVDGADRPFPQLLGGLPGFQAVKPARTPRARPWRSIMVARRTPSIGAMGAGGKGHNPTRLIPTGHPARHGGPAG